MLVVVSASAQTLKLESGWQFLPDRTGALTHENAAGAEGWRAARVGLSWNAQFEDLRDYMGVGWYRARFDAPGLGGGRRALLRFGAVDYFAEVYLNGQKAGEHEGGYTPFHFDVTGALKSGANELLVRVTDPPMDEKENIARFPSMLYKEIPHGKQNWYVQTGGIWQPVRLEVKPAEYIKDVQVVSKTDGSVTVFVYSNAPLGPPAPAPAPRRVSFAGDPQKTLLDRVSARVVGPSGDAHALKLRGGGGNAKGDFVYFEGRVPDPKLWGIEQPNLYTVEVALGDDRRADRFGFRSFEARDGRFFLNGQPYYMLAALDQDFYPETIYNAPSEDYLRDQMMKAKRMGLNMLRCHIKVCEPEYLKVADEVGMLVWYEIPSWNDFNHFSAKAAERGEKVFEEMLLRDWNRPSIVVQSIINESWGADLKQPEQRRWLLAAFDRAKKLTAPRGILVVDNSACCDNFHLKTDIDDFHRYNSIPDYHEDFDRWVADFAARPRWSFSPHGDAVRTNREPLVVSEFGNWGLPRLPAELPWWFARDFAGREMTRPAGVRERFKEFQLSNVFPDYDALAEATQWHQFRSLKHEIEEIRRHDSIQGYVITEFTDINWEVNGLLDMWRNPKAYASELAKIQQPDVLLARLPKRNFESGERVELEAFFSHYSAKALGDLDVTWRLDAGGQAPGARRLASPKPGGVTKLSTPLTFVAPPVDKPRRVRLTLEAKSPGGAIVAENGYDIFVYPKPGKAEVVPLVVHAGRGVSPELARALSAAGYVVRDGDATTPGALLIAATLDGAAEKHLRGGGRAVILADSKEAFPAGSPFKAAPREGELDGNWVTNFNWVRKDAAPFDSAAVDSLLGFEGVRAVPRFVIQGVPGAAYSDVLSGIFYGWINHNAALMVGMRAGEGKLLATTFRFGDYGRDPFTTRLFDALVRHVSSPRFAPRLEWRAGK